MIRSMTGVGRAETSLARKKTKLIVEIRSANHKFIETNLKLPTALSGYEDKIRQLVSDNIFRGSIQMSVSIHGANEEINQNNLRYNRVLGLDYELLSNLMSLTRQLKKKYKIAGELDVNTVLQYPGMIVSVKSDVPDKTNSIWLKTKQTVNRALKALNKMKKEEGAFLYKDFLRRIQTIAMHLKSIEGRSKAIRKELHAKAVISTRNRDASAAENNQIELLNSSRATTEEVVRLNSHIRSFVRTIRTKKIHSVGRKLEFILAEMLREIETILAKGRDTSISRDGIQIKEEIDALREQVRNVE
ncbi:MAG: DUF1732 domain-containing protein [Candidatus Latescibacteria bacterium]|nr:DUF1732 domain-containing protein [Candidatus Latescibacterota bacterium]